MKDFILLSISTVGYPYVPERVVQVQGSSCKHAPVMLHMANCENTFLIRVSVSCFANGIIIVFTFTEYTYTALSCTCSLDPDHYDSVFILSQRFSFQHRYCHAFAMEVAGTSLLNLLVFFSVHL